MERKTWLVWREQGSDENHGLGFFAPFFPPEKVQTLVALSLLRGAAAASWGDALGSGHCVVKHPEGRCSCIDSSGGVRDGCLTRAAIVSSLLVSQPRGGKMLFINHELFIRLVFLCGGRTGYSAGMLFGVSGGFNLP